MANRLMILGPDSSQAPFLDYDIRTNRWRVWQTFDPSVTNGTFVDLYPDGSAERVTTKDGIVQDITLLITGAVIENRTD